MYSKLSALLVCSLAAISALAAPPVRRQIQLGVNVGGSGHFAPRENSATGELLPGELVHGGQAGGVRSTAGQLTGVGAGGIAEGTGGSIGGGIAGSAAESAISTFGGTVDEVTGEALHDHLV
ncbi:hypothetical protein NP233_g10652 [Leucocoprinus birnbaumii]|uniref:Uncharacterized protein n=1 Tax=Leucocoprinus birnbaumii TaxID=56174 RepID=A0AAD5VHW2_9AGAR|nr:hypothetical protein NP233_g10652 [Leucocoprinus birnbaumii]